MDSTGQDTAPSINASPQAAPFFVIFIVLTSFFLNGLFVGAVFDTFVKMRDEYSGYGFLTDPQRNWLESEFRL
jgi:hypothetical protein